LVTDTVVVRHLQEDNKQQLT